MRNPIYYDDNKARKHLEALRWQQGPACPHCGVVGNAKELKGKTTRPGLYKCNDCRKPFSVTVGTIFERSHIPLSKWLLAVHLMVFSKKGISAHQIHRMLGITYKSAWFMCHRIREAMASGGMIGGEGQTVEVDETYLSAGRGRNMKPGRGTGQARVTSMVERNGRVKSVAGRENLKEIVKSSVKTDSAIITDEYKAYHGLSASFKSHDTISHSSKEWVRGSVHTNTVEGFFSIFKRGMQGVYQHCGKQHLHRYLAEFDFRYSHRSALGVEDVERADIVFAQVTGKRLTYKELARGLE